MWRKEKGCIPLGSRDPNNIYQYRHGINEKNEDMNLEEILDFKMPDLNGFPLKPYVAFAEEQK